MMLNNMPSKIELRPLVIEDAPLIFQWRNDPFIVALGSRKKQVTWDEHYTWMQATVHSNMRKAFLILLNNTPIGQVRFDRESSKANCVISVYLLQDYTGKGLGVASIVEGCSLIREIWSDAQNIYAYVLKGNINAQKAFLKTGFVQDSLYEDADHFAFVMKYQKSE